MSLIDVWRIQNGNLRDYTCFLAAHNSYSLIDFLFVSHHLLQWNPKTSIDQSIWSDHVPIRLTFVPPGSCKGAWTWRLNGNLLRDKNNVEIIKEIQTSLQIHRSDETSLPIQWETLKCVLRGKLIQIGTRGKKQKTKKVIQLLEQIQELNSNNLQEIYHQAFTVFNEKARKYFYNNANKCGKALARRLHPRNKSTFVPEIRNDKNALVHTPTDIAKVFCNYYKKL